MEKQNKEILKLGRQLGNTGKIKAYLEKENESLSEKKSEKNCIRIINCSSGEKTVNYFFLESDVKQAVKEAYDELFWLMNDDEEDAELLIIFKNKFGFDLE